MQKHPHPKLHLESPITDGYIPPTYTEEGYIDPYQKFVKKDLELRDELAITRTKMAQERTQLSYIRTGISLLLGGMFFVGYFENGNIFSYVGYITVAVSLLFLVYGFYHHRKSMSFVNRVMHTLDEDGMIRDKNEEERLS
ncbi:DUF202 domain-containing protein [Candidatus Micrarchaeota archaeon]|nr:DUF202 domain-containing protein [Candidatus Micrarchaeota archaeon]MBU1165970.1 DUF202 domain-containing protein [Candidatus Micrarchaeota archaeon]MBU1886874.1 DUF202 domain-containing protein [Candidatus Micrarchaeota archaeon]